MSAVPPMMRAVRIHEFGPASVLKLEQAPRPPAPGAGEMLVRVHAAAVNPIDWKIRASGGQARLTTVQGGTLTARLAGSNVVLTDAKGGTATVVAADLMQSNGIIHVTDSVSLPM